MQEVSLRQLLTGEMKPLELEKTTILLILQNSVKQHNKDSLKDQQV